MKKANRVTKNHSELRKFPVMFFIQENVYFDYINFTLQLQAEPSAIISRYIKSKLIFCWLSSEI